MKAKDLRNILSKVKDDEEVVFDRYDHFSDNYECYDFENITYSNPNIIELKRRKDEDSQIIQLDEDNDSDELQEELNTNEMLDDIMDEGFVLTANL